MTHSLTEHHHRYLKGLQQDRVFQEILESIQEPRLSPFKPSKAADNVEAERASWIYESGKLKQYQDIMNFLRGTDVT